MSERKSKPKACGPRTEVFAMRFDPKLKYLAEICARKQRRSLANFVEWSVEQALRHVPLDAKGESSNPPITAADKAGELWSPDEPTRLVNLATLYPDLLTYEERLVWDVICDYSAWGNNRLRIRFRKNEVVHLDAVRECWPVIKSYALGTDTREDLDSIVATYDWMKQKENECSGDKDG